MNLSFQKYIQNEIVQKDINNTKSQTVFENTAVKLVYRIQDSQNNILLVVESEEGKLHLVKEESLSESA